MANSFPRPLVKRSSCIAIANMVGNTATIYGSYMYPSSQGPQYVPGGAANAVICLVVAGLALALRRVHQWENAKLERAEAEAAATGEDGKGAAASSEGGAGGGRIAGFRYIY